jgi:hypothetical protein
MSLLRDLILYMILASNASVPQDIKLLLEGNRAFQLDSFDDLEEPLVDVSAALIKLLVKIGGSSVPKATASPHSGGLLCTFVLKWWDYVLSWSTRKDVQHFFRDWVIQRFLDLLRLGLEDGRF